MFDADDIDFDNEDQYLDGVPPLETVEDVANAESARTPRGPSPTPSEALTTNFGRNFRLNSPLRRQFIVEESAGGRKVFADSSSSSSSAPASGDPMNLLPVTRVLNLGKRKRQLAYYYLKKYGQPRPKMMPKPDDSNVSIVKITSEHFKMGLWRRRISREEVYSSSIGPSVMLGCFFFKVV